MILMRYHALGRDVWRRMDSTLLAELGGAAMAAISGSIYWNLARIVELALVSWRKRAVSDGEMVSELAS